MNENSPTEAEMRVQMFNTMGALSRMANTVTDYYQAAAKQSPPNYGVNPPGTDYSTLLAECGKCSGVVHIIDCQRDLHSPEDTCTCTVVAVEDLLVPPDVKALFNTDSGTQCPRGNPGPKGAQGQQGDTGPLADLSKIEKQLEQHTKALAIIGTFGSFPPVRQPFPLDPGRSVRGLVGREACRECGGTGWLARDETCKKCKRQGYIKS